MHSILSNYGFEFILQLRQIKKNQLIAKGLVLLVKCGVPVGIIRGYAAHPAGGAIALLWRCLALGARLEQGVRTNTPDDANKKPQLMVWGLVLLVKCGAPVGIDP
jgi:hypothetical protein